MAQTLSRRAWRLKRNALALLLPGVAVFAFGFVMLYSASWHLNRFVVLALAAAAALVAVALALFLASDQVDKTLRTATTKANAAVMEMAMARMRAAEQRQEDPQPVTPAPTPVPVRPEGVRPELQPTRPLTVPPASAEAFTVTPPVLVDDQPTPAAYAQ